MKFRKQGPKNLEDLYMLFNKVYITGASATCLGDISSSGSSDEDVVEVEKSPDNDDVKLCALKKAKTGKKKCKDSGSGTNEKNEKSPFF